MGGMPVLGLITTQRLVDREAVEQVLGIGIAVAGGPPGSGRVVGWLAPPGKLGDGAYYLRPDNLGRSNVACCQTGVASLSLNLEKSPCLTVDFLQEVFDRNGWSFSSEIHGGPIVSVPVAGQLVSEHVPFFEDVGELQGIGRLAFEFEHPGTNCATSILAVQFR